jgi:hypothetical protein
MAPQGTALLAGHYSTELAEGAHERLRRSGFAGITSKPSPMGPLDLEDFDALVFRSGESGLLSVAAGGIAVWMSLAAVCGGRHGCLGGCLGVCGCFEL